MIARWLVLLALLLPVPAVADTLEGSWALNVGETAIFRFDLSKGADGKWQGTWSKPASFASDGNSFSHLTGPPKHVPSMTALDTPNGIELSFNDPRPGAVPDIFDFKPIDPDAVEMVYVGTDLPPYTLERVTPDAALGPWDAKATYSRTGAAAKATTGADEAPAEIPQTVAESPPDKAPDDLPPIDSNSFRLKPGAPIGR